MSPSGSTSTLPKLTSFRQTVALDIILEQFGDITRDVAHLLCSLDFCTLSVLIKASQTNLSADKKLTGKQVRQALLVLLKYGLLIIEIPSDAEFEENKPEAKLAIPGLLYKLNIPSVLYRLQHGKLIQIVSEKYSAAALAVVEQVLLNGKASLALLTQRIDSDSFTPTALREALELLVKDRLLIMSDTAQSQGQGQGYLKRHDQAVYDIYTQNSSKGVRKALSGLTPQSAPEAAHMASVGAKAVKRKAAEALPAPAPTPSVSALPIELQFFSEPHSSSASAPSALQSTGEGAFSPTKVSKLAAGGRGRGRGAGGGGRGGARGGGAGGRGAAAALEESLPSTSFPSHSNSVLQEDVNWSVNYEQILRLQRHLLCTTHVLSQHEQYAADIASVLLAHSLPHELSPTPSKSSSMSLVEITESLSVRYSNNPAMQQVHSEDLCKRTLELLRVSPPLCPPISRVNTAPSPLHSGSSALLPSQSYCVNMDHIVEQMKRKVLHRICSSRYDTYSARILECLHSSKYMEQQALADKCILPARETREKLYRLFRDGWVQYIEFSKRNDFNPTSSFYFWYIDVAKLHETVIEHMYHSVYNLRLRRAYELEKAKNLVELGKAHISSNLVLSVGEQEKYVELRGRVTALELATQQIDSCILLFEHF